MRNHVCVQFVYTQVTSIRTIHQILNDLTLCCTNVVLHLRQDSNRCTDRHTIKYGNFPVTRVFLVCVVTTFCCEIPHNCITQLCIRIYQSGCIVAIVGYDLFQFQTMTLNEGIGTGHIQIWITLNMHSRIHTFRLQFRYTALTIGHDCQLQFEVLEIVI